MALDILLWAPSKSALATWAATHPANDPLWQDGEARQGVSYCWWAGSGQFRTANGVYDQDGNEITPPVFASGVVALMKFHSAFFEADKLADQTYDENGVPQLEQWQRSNAAAWIKNNGIPGTTPQGVNYYEVDGIRLFRPDDVLAFLEANNIAGHTWVDGCEY